MQLNSEERRGRFAAIYQSTFLRHNAIFFVGALVIGALNYAFYPAMARLLHPDSFGEVQVLFSLFAQITVFFNVLSLLVVNIVANYTDVAKRNRMIVELEKLAVIAGVVIVLTTALAGTMLEHFFHFDSSIPFMLLAVTVLVTTPLTFRSGFLRGRKRFGLVALAGIAASACDLVFSIILVLAGHGTIGAMLGLAVAQCVAVAVAVRLARREGFAVSLGRGFGNMPDLRLILPELRYAGLVLVGSLTITGLYSIDTIAVKHYFDARTAGLYAGVSTVARIIFFLTASIVQVLLPSVRLRNSTQQNSQVLLKSFVLLAGIGGAVLAVFVVAPRFVMSSLLGNLYVPYAELLPRLSVVVYLVSILNLFIMYHMALRRYTIVAVAAGGAIATVGLLAAHHQSLQAVVSSLLYGSLVFAALLAGWSAFYQRRSVVVLKEEMG